MYLQQSSSNPESWDIRENEMTTARSLAETDEGNERKRVGSQQSLEGTSLSSDPCDAEVSTCNKKTVYTAFLNHFYFIVPISWPFFIELFPNHFAWNFNTTDLSYVCLCTVCSLCIYTYTHTHLCLIREKMMFLPGLQKPIFPLWEYTRRKASISYFVGENIG